MDEWIRVEERLPEPLEAVLIWIPDAGRIIGRWLPSRGEWKGSSGYYYCRRETQWMPLPKLPKKMEPFYVKDIGGGWSNVTHRGFGHIWSFHDEKSTKALCCKLNGVWGFISDNS